MKRLMHNIKWEAVRCHLCGGRMPLAPLIVEGAPLVHGQFGYVVHPVLCGCGLVFLNPRWSKKDFTVFYENYYDDLYRLEIKPDYGPAGVRKNMETVWRRAGHHIQPRHPRRVLDVGAGSGYGLNFLREQMPEAKFFAIEASPECVRQLQSPEIGVEVIAADFDSDWQLQYPRCFDWVILRHVVEHMLDPVTSLAKIEQVLAPGGVAYFSTPDMLHPRLVLRDYDDWWEYWFRPVHPYYYSVPTLMRTLALAGLHTQVFGEKDNEEAWCLAGGEISKALPVDLPTPAALGAQQAQVLVHALPQGGARPPLATVANKGISA